MGVLPDGSIYEFAADEGMIYPVPSWITYCTNFSAELAPPRQPGRISSGLSSYGYDMTLADTFYVFDPLACKVIDPKNFDPAILKKVVGPQCVIPANSFALGVSVERFKIPRDVVVLCLNKSTYARCGIHVATTVMEPEWEGNITIEISNTAPLPAIVYAGEGIAQLLFLRGEGVCEVSYADKKGKYQNQGAEPTLPK